METKDPKAGEDFPQQVNMRPDSRGDPSMPTGPHESFEPESSSVEAPAAPLTPSQTTDMSARDFALLLREVRSWARDIFFAALTAILIVVFIIQPVKVEGTSMQPHLADQERIFVNKFVYHFTGIERGDIVVFWYPKDPTKSFIKRVIGLPGEDVEIRNGVVYIHGEQLSEDHVRPEFFDYHSYGPIIVPDDCYFVMGDHRNSSNDSRHWGCVPSENIFGKAVFRYWPMSKLGVLE